MFEKPKQLTAAAGLALIGAIVSFIAAFIAFDSGGSTVDGAVTIGALVLAGIMFLAISGALNVKGQWSWRMAMFAIFMTAVLIVVAFIYHKDVKAVDNAVALLQFAIILTVAVLTAGKRPARWIDQNKAA